MKLLPTISVVQMEQHLTKVANLLTEEGRKEAQEGKEARPIDDFIDIAARAFRLDPAKDLKTVQAVADLWESVYMNEYNAVKEVRSA